MNEENQQTTNESTSANESTNASVNESTNTTTNENTNTSANENTNTTTNSNPNKAKIVLAYIIPLLGLIFVNTEKTASEQDKTHYAQAATIFIVDIILSVIVGIIAALQIPVVSSLISLLPTAMTILAIIAAVKSAGGELFKIPVVFDFSQKMFGKKN